MFSTTSTPLPTINCGTVANKQLECCLDIEEIHRPHMVWHRKILTQAELIYVLYFATLLYFLKVDFTGAM